MTNKYFVKKISSTFILLIILFNLLSIPTLATNEKIIINDNANLLTLQEEENLSKTMERISEFGGVAFVTTDNNSSSSAYYAEKLYREYFGKESGIIFLIDMDNREIYIFTDGDIHKYIKSSKAYEITSNVYRYASNEEYYICAEEAFIQAEKLLNNEIVFAPMRYITGILTGICTSLLVCIIIVYMQRKYEDKIEDITETKYETALKKRVIMTHQSKKVHTSSSSSSSGGSSGGGGGSSGGGGGHSF